MRLTSVASKRRPALVRNLGLTMWLPRTTPGHSPGRRWPWGIAASLSSAAAGCARPSPWKTPPSLTTVPPWSAATRPTPGTCGKGSAGTCGECAPADRLILASDALACWFLAKNAAGQNSWETLLAFAPHHAPRRNEATALGPGPADEPSRGVRGEPASAQADRGGARLAEDCRGGRKLRYCGVARNGLWAEMALAAYNLVRIAKLMPPP